MCELEEILEGNEGDKSDGGDKGDERVATVANETLISTLMQLWHQRSSLTSEPQLLFYRIMVGFQMSLRIYF